MRRKLIEKWPVLFILLLSFWAIRPLFHSGFFPMHDDEQIARLYELHQALSTGQFPPRWIPDLGFGYGYPFYNFYPPLVYYFGEIFYLLGFSLIASTKIVMALGFLLSGLFIYFLAKEFFGKIGGVISAVFYIYTPYHALDLYVRGALAEFYSFVFLPAVFWSTSKLIKEKSKKWLLVNSLFLSFFLLSHNLITIIFLPFYFVYCLFLLWQEKNKKKIIKLLVSSFILFLGLTCYFWLPALVEKKYTLVDQILTRELANYKLHFVYLRQFWHSEWGYGGSIFGLEDDISFQVGKPHLIFSLLAGILSLFFLSKQSKGRKKNLFSVLCFLFFVFSLFMASFHSQFVWDKLQPLWYLQFPWRFLIFTGLFSSLLSGGIIDYLCQRFRKNPIVKLVIFTPLFLVVFLHKDYFQPARYLAVSDQDYIEEEELKWRVSKMSFEYVPKDVKTKLSDVNTTQLDLTKEEIKKESFEILSGNPEVSMIEDLPHKKLLKTKGEGELKINVFNFPGWQAFLDGKKIEIGETEKLRLIKVKIPQEKHRLKIIFTDTPVRRLANTISLMSILVFLGGLFYEKEKS